MSRTTKGNNVNDQPSPPVTSHSGGIISFASQSAWADNIPPFVQATPLEVPVSVRALLGCMPDQKVADATGYPVELVRKARIILKIKKYNVWTEEALALLGRIPTRELANRLGITMHAVNTKRAHMGIAPYGKHK